jgi:hypothetical protein
MRGFYTTYMNIGGMVYMALATNLLLALTNLPLLFLFLATDVRVTWLPVLALVPFLAISMTAAFAVFEKFTVEGAASVVRVYLRAWAAHARRAGAVGVIAAVGMFVLAVDITFVWGKPIGAMAIPLFVTFMGLLAATTLHVLAAIVLGVEAESRRALWKACLYFSVRRWYLTGMSLFAVLLLLAFIYATPAWGAGLAASPILYLAWTNSRQALLPIASAPARMAVNA